MDLSDELHKFAEDCDCDNKLKRKSTETNNNNLISKKLKLTETVEIKPVAKETIENVDDRKVLTVHRNPKQKLELFNNRKTNPWKNGAYKYGNYPEYYGYRNKYSEHEDIRMNVFKTNANLFENKRLLDIGCNSGYITMQVAKQLHIKDIIGIDIDRHLIKQANKKLIKEKKSKNYDGNKQRASYPFNVKFFYGNYVLADDVLLEIEEAKFDVILCLSVTKWIHLNFGDAGLKQTFRRMFLQLRPGGKLILEAQSFKGYSKRKGITDNIHSNFKAIQFLPDHFENYLLSTDVGFESVELLAVPEHFAVGFRRPIKIFTKSS